MISVMTKITIQVAVDILQEADSRFYSRIEDVTGLRSKTSRLRGHLGSESKHDVPEPLLSLQIPTEELHLSPRYATREVIWAKVCLSGTILTLRKHRIATLTGVPH